MLMIGYTISGGLVYSNHRRPICWCFRGASLEGYGDSTNGVGSVRIFLSAGIITIRYWAMIHPCVNTTEGEAKRSITKEAESSSIV